MSSTRDNFNSIHNLTETESVSRVERNLSESVSSDQNIKEAEFELMEESPQTPAEEESLEPEQLEILQHQANVMEDLIANDVVGAAPHAEGDSTSGDSTSEPEEDPVAAAKERIDALRDDSYREDPVSQTDNPFLRSIHDYLMIIDHRIDNRLNELKDVLSENDSNPLRYLKKINGTVINSERILLNSERILLDMEEDLDEFKNDIFVGFGVNFTVLILAGIVGLILSLLTRRKVKGIVRALASERAVYLGSLRSSHRRTMTVLLSLLAVSAVTLYHLSVPAEALLALALGLSVVLIVGFEVRAKDLRRLMMLSVL